MNVEQNVHVGTDRIADPAYDVHRLTNVLPRNEGAPWSRQRVELQRREAAFDHLFGCTSIIGYLLQLIAPAIGIDADTLAGLAAQ